MELAAKIQNRFQPLAIFAKSSHLTFLTTGSERAFEVCVRVQITFSLS